MTQTHATCNKCGNEAIVTSVEEIWNPANRDSRDTLVITIECANCGEREQPEATLLPEKPAPI
jgi:hypothetical protein